MAQSTKSNLRPVYFVSHGAPTFMYRDSPMSDAGAFDTVANVGKELLADPPSALVVISAHWQEEPSSSGGSSSKAVVGITATDGPNKLIYDFYGFPSNLYSEKFHSKGSVEIAKQIAELIEADNGFKVNLDDTRGVDHGLWVPLRIAFPDHSINGSTPNYVPFPVIQVSLPSSRHLSTKEETALAYSLGTKLQSLRSRAGPNMSILCSGMTVHNLRDIWQYPPPSPAAPYTFRFEALLQDAVEGTHALEGRLDRLQGVLGSPLARQAHPSLEHILPMAVAVGCSTPLGITKEEEEYGGKRLYSSCTMSVAWGMYRFGIAKAEA